MTAPASAADGGPARVATSADRLAMRMEQIIVSRLDQNRLDLPALPAPAAKCLTIVRDPNFETKGLVAAIEQDPGLAAQVLKLAGSAAYSYDGRPVTLPSAVVRLGAEKLTTLILDATTRQLYESGDPKIAASARAIYEHSVGVALLGRDLALVAGQTDDADTVYLCGLLHDVGKVVVAGMLLEAERMVAVGNRLRSWADSEAWVTAIERSHRRVGIALAQKWAFPQPVSKAIASLEAYDTTDRKNAANLVRFANALTKVVGLPGTSPSSDLDGEVVASGRSLLELGDVEVERASRSLPDRVRAQLG